MPKKLFVILLFFPLFFLRCHQTTEGEKILVNAIDSLTNSTRMTEEMRSLHLNGKHKIFKWVFKKVNGIDKVLMVETGGTESYQIVGALYLFDTTRLYLYNYDKSNFSVNEDTTRRIPNSLSNYALSLTDSTDYKLSAHDTLKRLSSHTKEIYVYFLDIKKKHYRLYTIYD